MTDMNLSDARLGFVNSKANAQDEFSKLQLTVAHVIASRPQLIHTTSKQSVTASDDYNSLPSDGSSTGTTVLRYQTPPSQMRTPNASRDALQSEAMIPPPRSKAREQPLQKPKPLPPQEGEVLKSKQVAADGPQPRKRTDNEISPPTPGVDDTPYIRFAIEQLSRDEELFGRRRQGVASEDSYPVGKIAPDEDISYRSTGHKRQHSDHEIHRPDLSRK